MAVDGDVDLDRLFQCITGLRSDKRALRDQLECHRLRRGQLESECETWNSERRQVLSDCEALGQKLKMSHHRVNESGGRLEHLRQMCSKYNDKVMVLYDQV